MNKRIAEASSLRAFFAEQWELLQQLIEAHKSNKLRQQSDAENLTSAVETIVEGTDARLRAVTSYKKRLRASARELLDHLESLVAEMPLAVQISQAAYSANSLVNALFLNTEAMHYLFSSSSAVRDFFNDSENLQYQEVFAVLLVNRTENNILGAELREQMILREVAQTSVSFSNHQLIAPRASEEAVRRALKTMLFETVVRQLKLQITQLRHSQTAEQKTAAMQNPERNINNPAVYMAMLVDQLRSPRELIRLQDNLLRVSKMGIKLPMDSRAASNKVRLYELEVEGDQSRVVTLVRYPRDEFRITRSDLPF